jgi:hypothetical protein
MKPTEEFQLTIEEFQSIYPNQLCLTLDDDLCQKAWKNSQSYFNYSSRWNIYLNQITLRTLLDVWSEKDSELPETPSICLDESITALLWEFVNGSIIDVNGYKIALIPSSTIDTEALYVQQEWVDIPELAANYYIAVQVLPKDRILRAWGFTTHAKLKEAGEYDVVEKTYILDRGLMFDNLMSLWVSLELCPESLAEIDPLPSLSTIQSEELLKTLCTNTNGIPRLDIDFSLWGGFLSSDRLRQKLYQLRMNPKQCHLSEWLSTRVARGWQTWIDFIENYKKEFPEAYSATQAPQLQALPLRILSTRKRSHPQTIQDLSQHIQSTLNQPGEEESCRKAIGVLGDMGTDSIEAVELLHQVICTAQDDETRWQAAFSLERLVPNHPDASMCRVKVVKIEIQFSPRSIAMIVSLIPQIDGRVGVWIKLMPADKHPQLPLGLSLIVKSELGQEKKTPTTDNKQEQYDWLQIRFNGQRGTKFQTVVSWENTQVVSEEFLI